MSDKTDKEKQYESSKSYVYGTLLIIISGKFGMRADTGTVNQRVNGKCRTSESLFHQGNQFGKLGEGV